MSQRFKTFPRLHLLVLDFTILSHGSRATGFFSRKLLQFQSSPPLPSSWFVALRLKTPGFQILADEFDGRNGQDITGGLEHEHRRSSFAFSRPLPAISPSGLWHCRRIYHRARHVVMFNIGHVTSPTEPGHVCTIDNDARHKSNTCDPKHS